MATYYRDFADADGISDWTEIPVSSGATDPAWSIVSSNQVQATATVTNQIEALAWNDIDSDANRDNIEILGQVYVDSTSTTQRYYWVRGSTSGASRTGYSLRVRTTSIDVYRNNGSTFTTIAGATISISSGTWCWVRFRVNGTALRARIWADGDSEPGTWDVDTTDSTYSTAGHVGLLKGNNTNTQLWRYFGVGTNGDTAPSSGSGAQTVAIGQATETDTAQAFTVTTTLAAAIGQASETDTAQALTPVTGGSQQTVGIGQASESDAAQAFTVTTTLSAAIGQVTETDTAQALTVSATRTAAIGQAQETDTAQALSPVVGGATLIGQASETDAAQPLTAVPGVRTVAIGQATEADSAQAMSARAVATILAGMALEIDTAQPLTALISGASLVIGQASELDIAQALAVVGGDDESYTRVPNPIAFASRLRQASIVLARGRRRIGNTLKEP